MRVKTWLLFTFYKGEMGKNPLHRVLFCTQYSFFLSRYVFLGGFGK